VLTGGLGFDLLFGGSGADRFDFNGAAESAANGNRDEIQDFNREALDKIDVSGIDANGTVGGNQGFVFVGADVFGFTPGQLRFAGGILSGSTDTDADPEFQIAVSGLGSMQASDLVL
jgi:Ca2+-binding RTX toxin-like protein